MKSAPPTNSNNAATSAKPMRVLYVAGPGDVAQTFERWRGGEADDNITAETYSGMFYDLCEGLGIEALVIASNARPAQIADGRFTIRHQGYWARGKRGLFYHLAVVADDLRLIMQGWRFGAEYALVSGRTHWFTWRLATLLGMRVVPLMHCAFWPHGHRPKDRIQRLIQKLNACFWRRGATATVSVSEEGLRQIREICPTPRGPLMIGQALYRRPYFDRLPKPDAALPVFNVLFAGRVEKSKGALDLVPIAQMLQAQAPGRFRITVCGEGSARAALERAIGDAQLDAVFEVMGHVKHAEMARALGRCHAVIVPTRSNFAEGLNKVVLEGVLSGRPVVTSRVSHAFDAVGPALVEAQVDHPASYVEGLLQLAGDAAFYQQKADQARGVGDAFFQEALSWSGALRQLLNKDNAPMHCPSHCPAEPTAGGN